MKAAVVYSFEHPPRFADFETPVAADGELLVTVQAAAISQLVRAQASGKHYSSSKTLPVVPGADGVGTLANGQRVYFAFPRAPFGAMAQTVVVKADQCVALPEGIDAITAAAIANPGMSSWAALQCRARFQAGESVLINGAAGASGRLAIQVARHLGASQVVATARNPAVADELRALGADAFIALDQPPQQLEQTFAKVIEQLRIDVVLDYLWGAPAACIINAAAVHAPGQAARRLRFVNIGNLAGASLPLPAGSLRSSGLELLGSGLGSVATAELVQVVGQLLRAVGPARLRIDATAVPLREVETAWGRASAERIVLTL